MKTLLQVAVISCVGLLCSFVSHSSDAHSQNVTLKIKDGIFEEHYYPSLSGHFPAAGLQPSNKVTRFIYPVPVSGIGAKPDRTGSITIKAADKPYYRIDGLTLYIEPGTILEADLKSKRYYSEVVFYGKNAAANKWLNQAFFINYLPLLPLNTEFDTLQSYTSYRQKVLNNAKIAGDELKALTAGNQFKSDGSIRLKFITISALLNYWNFNLGIRYSSKLNRDSIHDTQLKEMANAFYTLKHDSIIRDVEKLLPAVYKTSYNDLPEVVTALSSLSAFDTDYVTQQKFPGFPELNDMMKVMGEQESRFFYSNRIDSMAKIVQDPALKNIVRQWQKNYGSLQPQMPAVDINLKDTAGNLVKLSDLKGKSMYIDIWATWCGPCVQLKPEFEKLAIAYKDQDISFITISTDKNMAQWKAYVAAHSEAANIKQYIVADDAAFTLAYQMQYIPRFILIDKEFKFLSALAPRPYDPEIHCILDRLSVSN